MSGTNLSTHPLHLGLGATAEVEPLFTGDMSWYESYSKRHHDDGREGRLVNMHSFLDTKLAPGEYAVNEPGTWHTADVDSEATVIFITAGLGTERRQRNGRK